MRPMNRFGEARLRTMLLDPIVPLLITGFMWFSSPYQVELFQVIPAFFLAYIPWVLFRNWQQTDRREFPLLAPVIGMYWLAFALPLFWGARQVFSSDRGPYFVSDLAITRTMYLTLEGATALCFGAIFSRRIHWFPTTKLDIPSCRTHRRYLG